MMTDLPSRTAFFLALVTATLALGWALTAVR
jgi:hypothetical protein